MIKRFAVLLVAAIMLLVLGGIAEAEAAVGSKQIKVDYNNIKIIANGELVSLSAGQEPFLLNGVTYVPLRVAGEALKSQVSWEATTKTVYITGSTTTDSNLKAQLALKDQEIANLKKQITELEKKIDGEKDKDDTRDYDDLSDLEYNLLDDCDDLEDVHVDDIILDGDDDYVKVEVEVDLDDYEDEWERLTDREIEDWLEYLVQYIQDKLTEDTIVDGVIYDIDDDRKLIEFYKKGDDRRLDVEFKDDYYRGGGDNASEVEDDLINETFDVDDLEFTISDIDYDEDDDEVNVYFEAEDYDCREKWDELSRTTIEDAVEDISDEIAGEFEDEDVKVEGVRLYFYDEDDDLLDSYRYNVD